MLYFIVNPKSSSGKGLQLWQTAEQWLKTHHISYEAFFTENSGHASALAKEISLTKAPCTIVGVGGDGTINEIINGLENFENILFSCLPTGSGNDLARGLSLLGTPKQTLEAIAAPKNIRHLNIGVITTPDYQRRFLVSSGVGFDAAVCHEVAKTDLKAFLNRLHLGKLTYLLIALKQLIILPLFTMETTIDDEEPVIRNRTFFAAAMNLPYEGGGFKFCPKADCSDDYLDLCLANQLSKPKALSILPTAFFGKHERFRGVTVTRFRQLTFRSLHPMAIHTDGEPMPYQTEVQISLCENKLPFILG